MTRILWGRRLTDFDLKLLGVFSTIVDCRGVSAASIELNVDRSSVSKQLADLEVRLGLRLCERGRAGFALTAEGREVYLAAQELFRSLDAFGTRVSAVQERLTGHFHVAMADGVVTNPASRLPAALRRFHARAPNVHSVVTVSSANAIERGVLGGEFDVGFVPYHHSVEGLSYVDLFSEHAKLYCGRSHRLYGRPPAELTPDDLAAEPYVEWGYAIDSSLIDPRLRFAPGATVYNNEGASVLILSGRYIGFLPVHFASEWEQRGELRALLPGLACYTKPIAMITRQRRESELLIEMFCAECRAAHEAPGAAQAPGAA